MNPKSNYMKYMLFIWLFCFCYTVVVAQSAHQKNSPVIYLVRHAEKEKGNDPALTDAGKKRAGDLLRVLKDKKLQRIYVTQFRRTQMTADSLRIQLGVDTVHYQADTTGMDLLEKIKSHNDKGNTILIIGHSNTLPIILKKLGVKRATPMPGDNEFDKLFILKNMNGGEHLTVKKYGAKPLKNASETRMAPLQ